MGTGAALQNIRLQTTSGRKRYLPSLPIRPATHPCPDPVVPVISHWGLTAGRHARDTDTVTGEAGWGVEAHDYIDRLHAVFHGSALHAGAEIRADEHQVILFCVGGPDDALVSVINEAPSDVTVTLREAPYTRAELSSEVVRIMTEGPAGFNSGGVCHDGTGIVFTTTDRALLDLEDPRAALGARFSVLIKYRERVTPC